MDSLAESWRRAGVVVKGMDTFTRVWCLSCTIFVSGLGATWYYDGLSSWKHPAESGVRFLRNLGYTVLDGGSRDYSKGICGDDWSIARRYHVEKDGVREEGKVVCFSRILQAHWPKTDDNQSDVALQMK